MSERLVPPPHTKALEAWRASLTGAGPLPHFDPLDGGVEAQLLLLLETPAPGNGGVRFVSRDNATGTARNLTRFLAAAGLPRTTTLLWNAVPWVLHAPGARNRAPRRAEIAQGLATLPGLLALLPRLRVTVLAGRVAAQAEPVVRAAAPGAAVMTMPHPSPTYVCTSPTVATRIAAVLADAAAVLAADRCIAASHRQP